MKSDSRTYARATAVCLMGAGLQLALGAILLIYGLMGAAVRVDDKIFVVQDHAAITGGYFILIGLTVWIALAVVFDQHRRERLEAMENEALDQAGGKASVFESAAEDLRVNARRLAWMHRFLLPGVSLGLGAALLALAYFRYTSGSAQIGFDAANKDNFSTFLAARPALRGWAMSLAIGIAVIGFIFARFVSGMAKQPVWSNLRGGAGYAVAASLVGVIILLGHFVDLAGTDVVLRYGVIALPVAIGVLGLEIYLSFLLNLYRPRKAGETPRPAFDSPVLSFVASPDRIAKTIGDAISYQFGVDVSSSWAYRLLSRSILALVLMGGVVVWLLTTISVIAPNERGLRVRYGALVEQLGPGLHFKLPWPLETIDRESTSLAGSEDGVPGVDLATAAPKRETPVILWTNDHKVEEFPVVVQASRYAKDANVGQDLGLMIVEIPLVYRIANVEKWDRFASPNSREDLLRARARREILIQLATLTEDDLVGAGRVGASDRLMKAVDAAINGPVDKGGLDAGVKVEFVGITGVHPPKDAATKYEEVVSALQQRERIIEGGRVAENEVLAGSAGDAETARRIVAEIDALVKLRDGKQGEAALAEQELKIEALIVTAGGRAGQVLAEARSQRWARHMNERGQAEGYNARLAAYRANPKLYMAGLYFNTLTEVMKDARVFLVSDDVAGGQINLDLKELDTGGNVLTGQSSQPK